MNFFSKLIININFLYIIFMTLTNPKLIFISMCNIKLNLYLKFIIIHNDFLQGDFLINYIQLLLMQINFFMKLVYIAVLILKIDNTLVTLLKNINLIIIKNIFFLIFFYDIIREINY